MPLLVIYGLFDPRTHACCYVGQTVTDVKDRLANHLRTLTRDARGLWLAELYEHHLVPRVEILEIVRAEELNRAESFWMNYLSRLRQPLTNGQGIQRALMILEPTAEQASRAKELLRPYRQRRYHLSWKAFGACDHYGIEITWAHGTGLGFRAAARMSPMQLFRRFARTMPKWALQEAYDFMREDLNQEAMTEEIHALTGSYVDSLPEDESDGVWSDEEW